VLQAAGGAIASGANTPSQDQMGINIMIAGLSPSKSSRSRSSSPSAPSSPGARSAARGG